MKDSSYRMKCLLCLPKVQEIKAFKNSPSNLENHIERKHVHHLKKYGELTANKLKRKHAPKTPSTIKQSTLLKTVSQKSIDKAVVRIDEASTEMKKKVTEAMRGVDHIATTTDCWSARRRSFIGVTAHWIDPDSLNRFSAALACQRLRGSHTFDVLAGALNDIHSEFESGYCKPLVDALQLGLKKRFSHMFHDPELIAAAILLPKSKATWTKDDATIRMGMDYIKDHLEEPLLQLGDGTSSSDEEDFFSAMKTSQAQESSKQLDGYLACSADHMELLKSFPAVCKLSLRLNTPLAA
ncbi:hypothetical protein J4Q44_G00313150 [Coregonus suidteri]|uniref:Uncharacterized protein n=1 Tax=Coregonus suidteri TaxID=861788 RepID=A0AAN8KZM2_9TELE